MNGTMRTGWRVLAVGVMWGAMVCPAMLAAETEATGAEYVGAGPVAVGLWGWAEAAVGCVHGERGQAGDAEPGLCDGGWIRADGEELVERTAEWDRCCR